MMITKGWLALIYFMKKQFDSYVLLCVATQLFFILFYIFSFFFFALAQLRSKSTSTPCTRLV